MAFADGFGAPLVDQSSGSSTTNDAFWLFNGGVAGNRPGFNANEVEVFNSSKISKQADGLHLIATYTPNVASGKNYTTGMVTTSPNTSLTGFEMMLGGGETWGVEAVTKMAPGYDGGKQSGGNDEGWWTDTIGWKDEFDFFEHWGWSNVPSTTGDVWIYSTSPLHNTSITSNLSTFCRCDPSAAFHRYTTLINPNNTFSFYMDGKLVGTHAAPPSFQKMWMRLLLSYGLRAPSPNPNPIPGFQSGSRDWVIRSVAIYQDNAHADKDIQKGGIAPGTTIVP